eukprot:3466361-Heterocapsa_arctica.AAC.1
MAMLMAFQTKLCVHNSVVRPSLLDFVLIVSNGCKLSPDNLNNIPPFLEHSQAIHSLDLYSLLVITPLSQQIRG